jgi:uncharacterized repeat protein (TIGR01451 family)
MCSSRRSTVVHRQWIGRVLVALGLVAGLLGALGASATAQSEATVTLSKSASVSSVVPGTPYTYTLEYSCSSLVTDCDGVTITDVLPGQLSLAASNVTLVGDANTTATNYDPATGTATFTMVNPLPAGTTGEVEIIAQFPIGTTPVGAAATNTGTISAANAPSASSNPVTVDADVTPSLATTKVLDTTPIVLDAPTTYTLTYTNTGDVNLTSPALVDTLPTGATFVSASGGGSYNASNGQVTWTLINPATPGARTTETLTVIYPAPPFVAGIPITNTATGTGVPLGTSTPISQPASATGTPVGPSPAVLASKSPGGPVALGRPFTYTVSVKNTGNVGLNPATMTDSLPTGATFVSATAGGAYNSAAGTVTWTDPNPPLAPGASFTATVTVTYNSPPFTSGQIVTNNLSVSGTPITSGPPATGTASVTNTLETPVSGGSIVKTLLTPLAQFTVNTPVQYQVKATNTGDVPLDNFTITDPLPTSSTFVSASNGGTYDSGTNTVSWVFAIPLAAGASRTVTVTIIYPSPPYTPGELVTNTAEATGTADGTPVTIGPASVTDPLQPATPNATIKKTDTKNKLAIGESDIYTITSTNTGNVTLSPFVVTDTLPDELETDTLSGVNAHFTDPRGITAARSDVLAYHDPTTGTYVPVATTCTGSTTGTCTGLIPTVADQVQITYTGSVAPGFSSAAHLALLVFPSGIGRSGLPVLPGSTIQNCATVSASALTSTPQSCTAQTATAPSPTMDLTKTRTSPSPVPPPSKVSWQLAFGAPASSRAPILNPVVTDCLPKGLDLVDPADPGDPANGSPPASFTPAPSIARIVDGCGADTIAMVWSWAGSDPGLSIAPGTSGTFTLNTQIQPGTSPGTLTNTSSVSAENNSTPVTSSATVVVASGASLSAVKLVKGSLDSTYTKYPNVGHTTIGGSADYEMTMTNTGNVPIDNLTAIDILPYVGDTAVLNVNDPRGSAWSPSLTGPVTAPAGVTVSYSTSRDPCRPQLNYNPPGCENGTFSTTPPSPISSVASLQFSYVGPLAPDQTLLLDWPMVAPMDAPVGTVAWNSFGYTGIRTDTGAQLAPAEPNEVGFLVSPYPLTLQKLVNEDSEETPPGLDVPVGQPVTYTYLITNPGDLTVGSIDLVDDPAESINCPSDTIAPHSTMTCTSTTSAAIAGQHSDTATVTGQPLVDGAPAGARTPPASDTANYFGATTTISLVKDVNGQHEPTPPGLDMSVGAPVTFTYLVTNTGSLTLDPVTVSDSVLGPITCPGTVLAPQASMTCTKAGGDALAGNHENTATATGQSVDAAGAPVGSPVSATDTGNYFGSSPAVSLVKRVNGRAEPSAPGLSVPMGSALTFTYVITNVGNLTLDPVALHDNVLGLITCPESSLAAGKSETCTASGGTSAAGQHENTGTVTGQGVDAAGHPMGAPVTSSASAFYTGSTPSSTPPPSTSPSSGPSPSTLAYTGIRILGPLLFGAALVFAGGFILAAERTRRRRILGPGGSSDQ